MTSISRPDLSSTELPLLTHRSLISQFKATLLVVASDVHLRPPASGDRYHLYGRPPLGLLFAGTGTLALALCGLVVAVLSASRLSLPLLHSMTAVVYHPPHNCRCLSSTSWLILHFLHFLAGNLCPPLYACRYICCERIALNAVGAHFRPFVHLLTFN